MRKNLLSVIIIALLVVNIVMTAFMMFTVIPANKKTMTLVGDVAAAMNLDLHDSALVSAGASGVSVEDTVTYDIEDQMTIFLRKGEDGKDHYAIVSVSLCMDSKHADYKTYGSDIASKESMIKNEINNAIGSLTYDECLAMTTNEIQDVVLEKIKSMYGSDFIYKVVFRDIMFS